MPPNTNASSGRTICQINNWSNFSYAKVPLWPAVVPNLPWDSLVSHAFAYELLHISMQRRLYLHPVNTGAHRFHSLECTSFRNSRWTFPNLGLRCWLPSTLLVQASQQFNGFTFIGYPIMTLSLTYIWLLFKLSLSSTTPPFVRRDTFISTLSCGLYHHPINLLEGGASISDKF